MHDIYEGHRKPKDRRVCERCREEYEPRTHNQKYCDKCRYEAAKAQWRAYYRENRERIIAQKREHYCKNKPAEHSYKNCAVCGAPFYPYTLTTSFYCSKQCKRIMEQRRKWAKKAGYKI